MQKIYIIIDEAWFFEMIFGYYFWNEYSLITEFFIKRKLDFAFSFNCFIYFLNWFCYTFYQCLIIEWTDVIARGGGNRRVNLTPPLMPHSEIESQQGATLSMRFRRHLNLGIYLHFYRSLFLFMCVCVCGYFLLIN